MSQESVPVMPLDAPRGGEVYKHHKGNLYEVVLVALHANDDVWMVVYKPLYDNAVAEYFARSLNDWNETIVRDGKEMKRFSLVK